MRKVTISFVMCLSVRLFVCPSKRVEELGSYLETDFFIKFYIREFNEDLSGKLIFIKNLTKIIGTLPEGQCTLLSYLAQFFLE